MGECNVNVEKVARMERRSKERHVTTMERNDESFGWYRTK